MLVIFALEQLYLEREKMKTKVEIFSTQKLKIFFTNLYSLFEVKLKDLHDLESCSNSKNLSIVFFENQDFVKEKVLKNILQNENFICIYNELSILEKPSLDLNKNMTAPLSISKFIDRINETINKKEYVYRNIELSKNFITNRNTKENNYLTQAENLILIKLFTEKKINKKLIEREVLDIKQDLNTCSIESHLNRIRKKLKKIDSDFSVFSKNSNIFLEIINPDK